LLEVADERHLRQAPIIIAYFCKLFNSSGNISLRAAGDADSRTLVIEPGRAARALGIPDAWQHRTLFQFLVARDLKGRYRGTALGWLWILVRPLLEMLTYLTVFGYIIGVRTADIPYPLHIYSGLVAWLFFSGCVLTAAGSLTANRGLMSKVFFPRLIIPLVSIGAGIIDLLVAGTLVVVLALAYRVSPGMNVVALPAFLLLLVVFTMGVGLLLASASVDSPDLLLAAPVVLRVWMYLSPIAYPVSLVPERFRELYMLNPFTVIIEGLRASVAGIGFPSGRSLFYVSALSALLLLLGLWRFRRTEQRMVDFL
jgi:lipopolysaccharide transport system permease protein